MKSYAYLSLLTLLILFASCASSNVRQLDPELARWEETSLAAFPDMVRDTTRVRGYFTNYELNLTSFLQRRERLEEYKQGYGCTEEGISTLQFVITRDARIRAPKVVVSKGEACDNALLLYLKGVRVNEPARINGTPVPILATLDVSL